MKGKNNSVLRVLKLDLRNFADVVAQFLLIMVFFGVMWRYGDMMSPEYVVMLFGTIIPLTMTVQHFVTYFNNTVGYSSSRLSFILGGLAMKPFYMLFAVVTILITHFIAGGTSSLGATMLNAAMLALIGTSFGDLLSVAILKAGRFALAIYIIFYGGLCGGVGAVSGMTASMGILDLLILDASLVLVLVALGLCALATVVSYLVVRRIEVR